MNAAQAGVENLDLEKLNDKDKAELRQFLANEQQRSQIQSRKCPSKADVQSPCDACPSLLTATHHSHQAADPAIYMHIFALCTFSSTLNIDILYSQRTNLPAGVQRPIA